MNKQELQQQYTELQKQTTSLLDEVAKLKKTIATYQRSQQSDRETIKQLRTQANIESVKKPQPIAGNNTQRGQQATTTPTKTNGVENSDTRVHQPMHTPDPIEKDPNPPTYRQLKLLAHMQVTYVIPKECIVCKADTKPNADLLISSINRYLNTFDKEHKPYRNYYGIHNAHTKDELQDVRRLAQAKTLILLIAKYGSYHSCQPAFSKDFNFTEAQFKTAYDIQTKLLLARQA